VIRADHILGGLSLVAGVLLFLTSSSITVSPFESTLSARFFPKVLGGCFFLLGICLLLRPRAMFIGEALGPLLSLRFIGFVVVTAASFLAFPYVDFRLSTAIFLFIGMLQMGSRQPIELCAVSIGGALGVWLIFRFGFSVILPTWI